MNASLVLVVVVLVAAFLGGRLGGATAAVSAAASFDFFFTRPYYSFVIHARDDIVTTLLLLVVGIAIGEIVVRGRRARVLASDRGRDLRRMQRYAELTAGGDSPGHLIRVTEQELTELLGLQRCWFEPPPFAVVLPELGHHAVTVWGDAVKLDVPDPAPSNLVAVPVYGSGRQHGRLVLELGQRAVTTIDPPTREMAVTLADRLGTALSASR